MARIVTVYRNDDQEFLPVDMSYIRWLKISEALGRLGHQVDIATNEKKNGTSFPVSMGDNLQRVPISDVRWTDYDVVKTLFHVGFQTLEKWNGASHPFIISKLGSVVASENRAGIYFYGSVRESLYETQMRIAGTSRYVTLLTEPARELWKSLYGRRDNTLIVPGATDREIPQRGDNPFKPSEGIPVIFAGNIYTADRQPEANAALSEKMNLLGRFLISRQSRLYFLGPGDTTQINRDLVTVLGAVPYSDSWNYLYHARVGVVLSAGPFQHNNESSKIYHYLRAGLPVVSEAGFPNDRVVRESGLGYVIENGNLKKMADKIIEAAQTSWNHNSAIQYILQHHIWDQRVKIYHHLIESIINSS